jgi:hypothetical protein
MIRQREAREIVVYRYDRWGRNAADSLANVRRVELAGGGVVSATEPLDPDMAVGKCNRTNAFALAELQSDLIGENWKAVHSSRKGRELPMMDSGFGAGLLRVHDPACKCEASPGHQPPRQPGEDAAGESGPACTRAIWLPGAQRPVITAPEWEKYLERRGRMREMPPGGEGLALAAVGACT